MRTKDSLSEIKKIAVPILRKNNVIRAGIFGSFARGEAKNDSDIDILIKFRGRKNLLDLVGVKQELEEKMKRRVDVVTYKSIHPLLKEIILNEEVRIYDER